MRGHACDCEQHLRTHEAYLGKERSADHCAVTEERGWSYTVGGRGQDHCGVSRLHCGRLHGSAFMGDLIDTQSQGLMQPGGNNIVLKADSLACWLCLAICFPKSFKNLQSPYSRTLTKCNNFLLF